LIPGLYETERCFYGALTTDIREILREHKADPNKFDHLGQNMQGLRDLMLHTDFTLTVSEEGEGARKTKDFHLHRFVLSMRSSWFSERFAGVWKGANEAVIVCSESNIMPSVAVASALLDFLYTSKVDVDEVNASKLADSLETLNFAHMASAIRKELNSKDRELRSIVLKPDNERLRLTQELDVAFSYYHGSPIEITSKSVPEEAWHDICLEVEDTEAVSHRYACHRALLCQHSAYFNAMISGHFREASLLRQSQQQDQQTLPVLRLVSISNPRLLRVAIRFLYTNSLKEELDVEDTIQLLLLCDQLLLMELKRLCAVRLRRSIDSSNAFAILRLGDTFGIRLLRQAALDYLERNIAAMHTMKEFEEALEELPLDIVNELKLYVQDKLDPE